MHFTADQSAKFWPIYKQYEAERSKIGDERVKTIGDYIANVDTLKDAQAIAAILGDTLARQDKYNKLQAKYAESLREGAAGHAGAPLLHDRQLLRRDHRYLQIISQLPLVTSSFFTGAGSWWPFERAKNACRRAAVFVLTGRHATCIEQEPPEMSSGRAKELSICPVFAGVMGAIHRERPGAGCSSSSTTDGGPDAGGVDGGYFVAGQTTESEIAAAFSNAVPGATLTFGPGTFTFTNTLALSAKNLTITGAGMASTILEFAGQTGGADGIDALDGTDGIMFSDFTLQNAAQNGIKVLGANGVTFLRVNVTWTGAVLTEPHGPWRHLPGL